MQLGFVYVVSVLHKYELGYKIWFQEGNKALHVVFFLMLTHTQAVQRSGR